MRPLNEAASEMNETSWTPYHLTVTKEDVASVQQGGRFVLLPGSPERAELISERFVNCTKFRSPRAHDVYVGKLPFSEGDIDVAVVSTGMGCPSVNIVVSELMLLGLRRFIRVGTAGSLQPQHVRVADVVIATGAVRDEGSSLSYAPVEVPAVASFELVDALRRAAIHIGLGRHTHLGLVHTKDSLYAREFGQGCLETQNQQYVATLKRLGVLATEMESSHLFILATLNELVQFGLSEVPNSAPCLVGSVLAVIGGEDPFADDHRQHALAVERAISVAVEGIRQLCHGISSEVSAR